MRDNLPPRYPPDCRRFRGDRPCSANKHRGLECDKCTEYSKITARILIIKLDSMGDVLRTTFLLPLIHEKWQDAYVVWITMPESVQLLEKNGLIDEVWTPSTFTLSRLHIWEWNAVFSLSNDHRSASLATIDRSKEHFGYKLSPNGSIVPLSETAKYWLDMAAFDRLKKRTGNLSRR